VTLITPDELIANNEYEFSTVPPSQKLSLEIENKLTSKVTKYQAIVKRNSVSYSVIL